MNLTKEYPRSPYEKVRGYVMLGRTIDKARAKLENALGEYMYDCPLDQLLFEFLVVDAQALLGAAKTHPNNDAVVQWVQKNQASHSPTEIEKFNENLIQIGPEDEDSKAYFERARKQVAPNHPDLRSWFDLIEAEEGRLK